jgi:hypothetical protein
MKHLVLADGFCSDFSSCGSSRISGLYAGSLIKIIVLRDLNFCQVKKDQQNFTALQTVIYSLLLLPMGVVPYLIGMSGTVSLFIVTAANLFMVWQCVRLYREMEVKAARRVMFSSYIYLPVVLFALLGDKL